MPVMQTKEISVCRSYTHQLFIAVRQGLNIVKVYFALTRLSCLKSSLLDYPEGKIVGNLFVHVKCWVWKECCLTKNKQQGRKKKRFSFVSNFKVKKVCLSFSLSFIRVSSHLCFEPFNTQPTFHRVFVVSNDVTFFENDHLFV